MSNRFATASRMAAKKKADRPSAKRRRLDDYETPEDVTERLLKVVQFPGAILEPAAGSGRIARVLRKAAGVEKVVCRDIKTGHDFLGGPVKPFAGHIVTNPPYRDGLAERFARRALAIADGKVAMLLQLDFLAGQKRATGLHSEFVPETIIVIPERIYFYLGGTDQRIDSQFFHNVWVVWPERDRRCAMRPGDTRVYILPADSG